MTPVRQTEIFIVPFFLLCVSHSFGPSFLWLPLVLRVAVEIQSHHRQLKQPQEFAFSMNAARRDPDVPSVSWNSMVNRGSCN